MGELVSGTAAQANNGAGSLLGMLPLLVGTFFIFYFLMFRPERKRQAEHQAMLGGLKKGDEVVLTSGIFGKIHSIEDKTLTLELADKVRIKVLKAAVTGQASRFTGAAGAASASSDDDAKKPKQDPEDAGKQAKTSA